MIDYEKLKMAHDLANKANRLVKIILGPDRNPVVFIQECDENGDNVKLTNHKDIDKVIESLQELTKQKPKYEIGQEVWFTLADQIKCELISSVDLDAYGNYMYSVYPYHIKEHRLFSTKPELIQNQIDYWTSLKNEEMSPPFEGPIVGFKTPLATKHAQEYGFARCKHESDLQLNFHEGFGIGYKCKKCGEFYK